MDDPVYSNTVLVWVSGAVAIASSLVTGVLAALVSLLLKWKRESAKTDAERNKATVELELTQKERTTKVDMGVHEQVVNQLTKIIEGYEERFREVIKKNDEREGQLMKQSEERELQFATLIEEARKTNQEMLEKAHQGHMDCERKLAAADTRVSMLERTVQDLQARVEARSTRRQA